METVMESMEAVLGALPRPGRVPEQDFCPPKFVFNGSGAAELFWEKHRLILGFWSREALYRRRGGVRGRPGGPHHPLAWPGGGVHHPLVWLLPGPPRLSFGLHLVSGKNRRFGLRFVQF
jgi:hypothetical protein